MSQNPQSNSGHDLPSPASEDLALEHLEPEDLGLHDLDNLAKTILNLAQRCQDHPIGLLRLLRILEHTHHQVREQYFQPVLPCTRHQLYGLLREMEEQGGWPYIPRMPLRQLLREIERNNVINSGE